MNYEVLLNLHDHEIYYLSCFMKDAERNIKSGVEIAVRIKLSVSGGTQSRDFLTVASLSQGEIWRPALSRECFIKYWLR